MKKAASGKNVSEDKKQKALDAADAALAAARKAESEAKQAAAL
ncbi:hypothetical protein [Sorangium sp. So ce1000]